MSPTGGCSSMATILTPILALFLALMTPATTAEEPPQLITQNGNLIIKSGYNKNVTIQLRGSDSFLNVGDENLLSLLIEVKNSTHLIRRFRESVAASEDIVLGKVNDLLNGILLRLNVLETTKNTTNRRPLFPQADRSLRRKVTTLERKVNRLMRLMKTNECNSNPCKNGGTCIDVFDGYLCKCREGWEGADCSSDFDECVYLTGKSSGCQNGGVCINLPGSYRCDCLPGWFGLHCARRALDCSGSQEEVCGHGTCVPQSSGIGITCICSSGWRTDGVNAACNIDVDECEGNRHPCSANPFVPCVNVPGSFVCGSCPNGYSGNGFHCSDIDECADNNGGCSTAPHVQCINTMGSRFCGACPPGYEGNGIQCSFRGICQTNNGGCHPLATCASNPAIGPTFVQCTCGAGLTGSGIGLNGCHSAVSPPGATSSCEPNPCIRGACLTTSYGRRCICDAGFSGVICDRPSDACSSSPCKNGGTCSAADTATGYACECPPRYVGPECQHRRTPCGGLLEAREGSIVFPETNTTRYMHNSRCAWVIKTTPDRVLNVTFTKFNLENSTECLYDWLQIHDGRNSASHMLGRYCGTTLPRGGNIISTTNALYMWFRSDNTVARQGFSLHWTSAAPECGGVAADVTFGRMTSPGSPGHYPPNRDCYWTLRAPPGKRLQIHFFTLQIESHPNCEFDYIEIFSGLAVSAPLLARFCNSSHPAPIVSPGPDLMIHFHSDELESDAGFQLTYAAVEGVPGCGGYYTNEAGEISSPSVKGKYQNQMTCEYKIRVSGKMRVKITFSSFDIEDGPSCPFDSLSIYDGDSTLSGLVGTYCGDHHPPEFVSSSNVVLVVFKSDWSVSRDGFRMHYEIVCSEVFTAPFGTVTSPDYPEPYPGNRECSYLISLSPGKAVRLTFVDFDVEGHTYPECSYDYLQIYDGDNENSTSIGKYCGSDSLRPPDAISTHNILLMKLKTDDSIPGRGFSANYTTVDLACGGILKSSSGIIEHPNSKVSDSHYEDDSLCWWVLSAPPGYVMQLTWIQFDLESLGGCYGDFVEIYENFTEPINSERFRKIGRFCGSDLPPALTSTSNVVTIVFKSDDSYTATGFSMSYIFLDSRKVCGGTYSSSYGSLYSPGWPNPYPAMKECVWSLRVESGKQILLNFTTFSLEDYSNCAADYLEIRNGDFPTAPLVGKFCGKTIPTLIPSLSNNMRLVFHSDASRSEAGFFAVWESTASDCGGSLDGPTGSLISPDYPQAYPNDAECYWKISTSAGSLLDLTFADLDLEEQTSCIYDYVEIFDSIDTEKDLIGRYCTLTNMQNNVVSSSNHIFVKFRTDSFTAGRGFVINYHTVCNTNITGYSGTIESFNFPSPYPGNSDCTWKIEVPKGNQIDISFSHFHTEIAETEAHSDAPCVYDYVEIGDDLAENKKSLIYCGSEIPPRYTSSGNKTRIRFRSDSFVEFAGFRLEWTTRGCGGFVRRPSGRLTSPRYPGEFVYETMCRWTVVVDAGKSVRLTVERLDATRTVDCSGSPLIVRNGDDDRAPKILDLCDARADRPVTTSSGNYMFIEFVADSVGRRFAADFETVESKCGGNFTGTSGTIHSENYPRNYEKNSNCHWYIAVPESHSINLTFVDFDVADAWNLKIYDGFEPVAAKLIGEYNETKKPTALNFNSVSNKMLIEFATAESTFTAKGFRAIYTMACDTVIVTESDGIINPHAGVASLKDVSECSWSIVGVKPSDRIVLTFTHMDISTKVEHLKNGTICPDGYVQVFNGRTTSSPSMGKFCGNRIPPTLVSQGNVMKILMVGADVNRGLFSARYSVVLTACGGDLTSESGSFASPLYPDSYPPNTECIWKLNTSPGNKVTVNFEKFELDSENCDEDYLEIRENDGSGKILGIFCGRNASYNATVGSKLWIKFRSDDDGTASGFVADYSFVHGNEIEDAASGSIASPLYPVRYVQPGEFYWRITVHYESRIRISFHEFDIDWRTKPCVYYLAVYDGYDDRATELLNECGSIVPSPVETSSNIAYVKLVTDKTGTGSLFRLDWARVSSSLTYGSPAETNSTCGGSSVAFLPASYGSQLSSPGYPLGYGTNLKCEWVYETNASHHLEIKFMVMSLEEEATCYMDKVSVYSGTVGANEWTKVGDYCLANATTDVIRTATNRMKIEFIADASNNRSGFFAQIYPKCGSVMSGSPSEIIAPSLFLSNVSVYRTLRRPLLCEWQISVRTGRKIKFEFLKFNINDTGDGSCKNYVMLRNGLSSDSPLLGRGKFCGRPTTDDELITTGNHLYVKFDTAMDLPLNVAKGLFVGRYSEVASECGGRLTLDRFGDGEIISSPNYPNIPHPHTECIWTVMAPNGHRLRIDFIDRFDLTEEADCPSEFVEVRDGGTEFSDSLGKFCSKSPPTLKTTGNFAYVKFSTDIDDPKNGFKAKISIDICGGKIYGNSGTISSPNSFEMFAAKSDVECVWRIVAPVDHSIHIEIRSLNLPSVVDGCANASLEIFDVIPYNKSEISVSQKLCNEIEPVSFGTSSNVAVVRLRVGRGDLKKLTNGFSLTYNASKDSCGGLLTSPEGRLVGPTYHSSGTTSRHCEWRITVAKGRRISLKMIDYDNSDISFDRRVTFYNDHAYKSIIKYDRKAEPVVVMSSSNTMLVYFWMRRSNDAKPFQATYTSDEPSVCDDYELPERGTLYPPKTNLTSYYCEYSYKMRGGDQRGSETLVLTFTNVTVANSRNVFVCRFSTSRVTIQKGFYVIDEICRNTTTPIVVRSHLPETEVKVIQQGEEMNFRIDYRTLPCGGTVEISEGSVPLQLPIGETGPIDCTWVVTAPDGRRLLVSTDGVSLTAPTCESEFLSIRELQTFSRGFSHSRICHGGVSRPRMVLPMRKVIVEYHADQFYNSTHLDVQFSLDALGCGGTLISVKSFSSPNYPKSYGPNQECLWEILPEQGFRISLTFIDRFAIEKSDNCSKDFVEVSDYAEGIWKSHPRLCGRDLPAAVVSTSNRMKVLFRSDSLVNGDGFKASWETICGGTFTAKSEKQILTSPGSPLYQRRLNCIYLIEAPAGHRVMLNFTKFDLESGTTGGGCEYDNLTLTTVPDMVYYYDSKKDVFCGKKSPGVKTFSGGVKVEFKTDKWVQRPGFEFSYSIDQCGGVVGEGETIRAPQVDDIPTNLDCVWNITAPTDRAVFIKFRNLKLPHAYRCTEWALSVYEGRERKEEALVASLCGDLRKTPASFKSKGNALVLSYKGNIYDKDLSFEVDVVFVEGEATGCGGRIDLADSTAVFRMPRSGSGYGSFLACDWVAKGPRDRFVQLKFESFHVAPCFGANQTALGPNRCICDYLEIRDGRGPFSPLIGRFCGHDIPEDVASSNEYMWIRFVSDGTVSSSGIKATLSSVPTVCGEVKLSAVEGTKVLLPPKDSNGDLMRGIRCTWTLSTELFSYLLPYIHLRIEDIDMAPPSHRGQCESDRLDVTLAANTIEYEEQNNQMIMQGAAPHYSYNNFESLGEFRYGFCGKMKNFDMFLGRQPLMITLTTSSESQGRHGGFTLKYGVADCDIKFTANQGRIAMNHIPENVTKCVRTIEVTENRTISLYFNEISNWLNETFIEVRDGKFEESALLVTIYGGYSIKPLPVFSTGNVMRITAKKSTYGVHQFDAVYTSSSEGMGCGGTVASTAGTIYSPRYPVPYRGPAPCEWIIHTVHDAFITLEFKMFDIGPKTSCDEDFLELRSKDDSFIAKYCSGDKPAKHNENSNILKIVHHASNNNGGGWIATFSTRTYHYELDRDEEETR